MYIFTINCMIFICCSYNFTYFQSILRRTELFCLNQSTIFLFCVFYISSSHAVSFKRIAKHNNLDVLKLSLPDRQYWVSWQRPSSFYFVKRTKTAARTLRAIYTACRRVCLRAKSCSGQEMRRAILLPVSVLYTQISTFSPFSPMSRPVYVIYVNCQALLETFLLSPRRRLRDEFCMMNNFCFI